MRKHLCIALVGVSSIGLGFLGSANAESFRSPDGRTYCSVSTTEIVTACMNGSGRNFRASVLAYDSRQPDSFRNWFGRKKTPRVGKRLRVGKTRAFYSGRYKVRCGCG